MSGTLGTLQTLLGSRSRLLPASYGGVPFYVRGSTGAGGRRLVVHEFPLRDTASTEDLGALPRRFKLQAFVIDDPAGFGVYQDFRDDLIAQCETGGAATLVHPTHGPLSCRSGVLGWSEHIVESFGYCEFQLDFVQDGPQPSPTFSTDTTASLLGGVASILGVVAAGYNLVVMAMASPAALLSALAGGALGLPATTLLGLANMITAAVAGPANAAAMPAALLGNFQAALAALPPATMVGLSSQVTALTAAPGDPVATATAVQALAQAMAANIIAAAAAPSATDAIAGVSFTIAPPADPSGGLAALVTWGNGLPAVPTATAAGAVMAAIQAAVVALVQGNVMAALVQVYASIDWPYASAAAAAREQVVSLIEAQVDAAAVAGLDDLYCSWRGPQAMTTADMIASAQALPQLGGYLTADAWPSLALAQALFLDPTEATALEDINDVPHPLFMPLTGLTVLPTGSAQTIDLT